MSNDRFLKTVEDAGLLVIDNDKLASDLKELNVISNAIPKDNVFSVENCLNLERLCLRGMNICDYWMTILHIAVSEKEVERDLIKNTIFINAGKDGGKLTVEMRKAYCESNEEYNKIKILVEKISGIKLFFEKKRETFKSAIFVFRDQLAAYRISDKGSSGEKLSYETDRKVGEVDW